MKTRYINVIEEQLGVHIGEGWEDVKFDKLGADSLDIVEITMACEMQYNIQIQDDEFSNKRLETLGDLFTIVSKVVKQKENKEMKKYTLATKEQKEKYADEAKKWEKEENPANMFCSSSSASIGAVMEFLANKDGVTIYKSGATPVLSKDSQKIVDDLCEKAMDHGLMMDQGSGEEAESALKRSDTARKKAEKWILELEQELERTYEN